MRASGYVPGWSGAAPAIEFRGAPAFDGIFSQVGWGVGAWGIGRGGGRGLRGWWGATAGGPRRRRQLALAPLTLFPPARAPIRIRS
jgi:hypothetical protein